MPAPQPEPANTASAPGKHRGMAIASMVIGILAFLTGWIPLLGGLLAIVSIVLGILAIRKAEGGMAIAGVVFSVIALLFNIIITVFFFFLIGSACTLSSSDLDCAASFSIGDTNTIILQNTGSQAISSISITAGDGCTLSSALDENILGPGDASAFSLDCPGLDRSEIGFEVSYTIGGESRRATGQA